jgi:hypothetical protein
LQGDVFLGKALRDRPTPAEDTFRQRECATQDLLGYRGLHPEPSKQS